MIRLYERQDIFKGDLNNIQQVALQWLMNEQISEQVEIEKIHAQITALSGNPHTNPQLVKQLFIDEQQEEEENVEWLTPQSEEELQQILQDFGGLSLMPASRHRVRNIADRNRSQFSAANWTVIEEVNTSLTLVLNHFHSLRNELCNKQNYPNKETNSSEHNERWEWNKSNETEPKPQRGFGFSHLPPICLFHHSISIS